MPKSLGFQAVSRSEGDEALLFFLSLLQAGVLLSSLDLRLLASAPVGGATGRVALSMDELELTESTYNMRLVQWQPNIMYSADASGCLKLELTFFAAAEGEDVGVLGVGRYLKLMLIFTLRQGSTDRT